MRKILFLDVDGVLNSRNWMLTQPRCTSGTIGLDRTAVARLNDLMERVPDLQIVVSSTWRILDSLGTLRRKFVAGGFQHPRRVIGVTSRDGHQICLNNALPSNRHGRGVEILQWLDRHVGTDPVGFAVLDDDGDKHTIGRRWILTRNDTGLLDEHVERAVAIVSEPVQGPHLDLSWAKRAMGLTPVPESIKTGPAREDVCVLCDRGLPVRGNPAWGHEAWMVRTWIWQDEARLHEHAGRAHLQCLQDRIGRPLGPDDFINKPLKGDDGLAKPLGELAGIRNRNL